VLKAVFRDFQPDDDGAPNAELMGEGWFNLSDANGMMFKFLENSGSGDEDLSRDRTMEIRNAAGDLPVSFTAEGAVPGDRIIGIMTPGKGITIFPIQSSALAAYDDQPERWIDVRWDIDQTNRKRFPVQIIVTAINAPGSLAEISTVIADNDANIHTMSMARTAPDFTEMLFDLEVWDVKHLNRLLSQLRSAGAVSTAERKHS
jgi:guanosine-3',5'-bis(diphosphate) 3'-pyrophosphohydrolase